MCGCSRARSRNSIRAAAAICSKVIGDLSAAGVEGAALFLVDDAAVSSRSEPQRLRSQTPARRARLCDELRGRHALAGRELRRAAGRDVSGAGRMQVLVVGAGVVGLAVARAAASAGHDVVVAEAASGIGTGVSSRNSEVIHAGLYYPTSSRRAYHCPRGRRMLYDFCASHGVPHRKCGKLVVATNAGEIGRLEAVHKQARANGTEGVEIIDAAVAKRLEPALACVAAMHSPETGIIDSHRFMLALRGDLEDRGGMVAFASPIEQLKPAPGGGWHAAVAGSEPQWLSFDAVVNCAG